MKKKQIEWVNVAKGIGIFLVVYGHVIIGIHNSGMNLKGPIFEIQESVIYSFHMPLFFFLSGMFVKKWASRDFKTAINIKLRTVLYPYFVWSLIQGLIMYGLGKLTNGDIGMKEIVRIPIDPIAQFWFLYVLFFCFVLYYLLNKLLNSKSIFLFSIALLIISPFLDFWVLSRIGIYFFFFVLGSTHINRIKTKSVYFILLFVISNIIIYMNIVPMFLNFLFKLLAGISGILLTINLSKKLKDNKILNEIGSASMSIYVMHIIAGSGIRVILLKLGVDSVLLHIVIGTLVGIIAPLIADCFVKKINLTKMLYGK